MQRVSTHGLQVTLALPLELSRTSIVDNYGCVARITRLEDSLTELPPIVDTFVPKNKWWAYNLIQTILHNMMKSRTFIFGDDSAFFMNIMSRKTS